MANKEIKKIGEAIQKANKKLETLEAQRKELDAQIKAVKNEIVSLEEERDAKKSCVIAELAKKNGISVDEIITALETKNFFDVQDKMEAKA